MPLTMQSLGPYVYIEAHIWALLHCIVYVNGWLKMHVPLYIQPAVSYVWYHPDTLVGLGRLCYNWKIYFIC